MGVFDQIKSAFGSESAASKKEKTEAAPTNAEPVQKPPYIVQSGDTLWKIADEQLGDGNRYTEIFEANRDVLESPDHILPGQELKVPQSAG